MSILFQHLLQLLTLLNFRFERNLTQSIRLQQDEAYELSLKADREKERIKQEELEAQRRVEESIEAEKQAEIQRKSDIEDLKLELAANVPSEPPLNSPDAISVVFKLPNGLRLERRFLNSHTLKVFIFFPKIKAKYLFL